MNLEIRAGGGGGSSGPGNPGGRGGQKILPSVWGGVDFFWNNTMVTYGICSMALRMWMARFVYELHCALVSCLTGHLGIK